MKYKEFRAMLRDNNAVLASIVRNWKRVCGDDPVLEARFAHLDRLVDCSVLGLLAAWVLFAGLMFETVTRATVVSSFVAFFLIFLIEFVLRRVHPVLKFGPRKYQQKVLVQRARDFTEAVDLLESKLGPLVKGGEKWTKGEHRIIAAERIVLAMADGVMRLQEIPWRERDADKAKKELVDTLRILSLATGIGTDLGLYFNAERIEHMKKIQETEYRLSREGMIGT